METRTSFKPGDLLNYLPERFGDLLTFDQLTKMQGELVLVDVDSFPGMKDTSVCAEVMRVLVIGKDSDGDRFIELEDGDGIDFPLRLYQEETVAPSDEDESYAQVWALKPPAKEKSMEILDLGLSVRAYNAVCRAGVKTIPELYHKYQLEPEWLHREIGQKHMHEVGDALAKHREEVWQELRKDDEDFRKPKAGDYLCDYDPEIWGDDLTFDELTQMVGKLVIVNDSWYPDTDTLEEDGEGDVLLVVDADGDVVHLRGDTPKIHEIMRQEMEDRIKIRYCTKVWRIKESEEITNMIQEGNTLSIENSCFISMRTDLDAMLQSTIDKMISKQSDEATITLKIGISLVDAVIGQPVKKPTITHKVTSAITTKESVDGYVAGDYSLYFDDDEGLYAMRELPPDGGQLPLL